MDAVQPTDPNRGLLLRFFLFLCQLPLVFGIFPPRVVCLIVYYENILRVSHLSQHFTGIGLVAFSSPFVYTSALFDGFLTVPRQRLPVGD